MSSNLYQLKRNIQRFFFGPTKEEKIQRRTEIAASASGGSYYEYARLAEDEIPGFDLVVALGAAVLVVVLFVIPLQGFLRAKHWFFGEP